jgi:hypothetical protein
MIERQGNLAQVLLRQHVFIPDHKLHHAQLVCKGKVDREIECRVFGCVDRAHASFQDGCLEACAEEGYHYESNQAINWGLEREMGGDSTDR